MPLPTRRSNEVKLAAPVPPLATGKTPLTSEVKEARPLNSEPPVERTRPVPKEDKVVEPSALTVNKDEPEDEARTKIFLVVVEIF